MVCPGFGFDKWFTETERRRFSGQQPETQIARDPVDQPLNKLQINRGFRFSIELQRISFARTSEETSKTVSSIRWRQEGELSSGQIDPTASRPTQPRPHRRPAERRPEPTGP